MLLDPPIILLKTQTLQMSYHSMSPDPKIIGTEAPKNDMVTVNLNNQVTLLNPNPNPMKTVTPKSKFKRIKKRW